MIVFDPSSKSTSKIRSNRRSNLKKLSSIGILTAKKEIEKNTPVDNLDAVQEINNMLFVQEFEIEESEDSILDKFGSEAIKQLKLLKIAMLNGSFQESHLLGLKRAFDNYNSSFKSIKHQRLADEIATRLAVEIAKLEMSNFEPQDKNNPY